MGFIDRLAADVTCLKGAIRTLKATTPIAKHPTRIFPAVVEELAEKYGDAPALLSEREHMSYRELAQRSNRYARWALAQGLGKGDTVCLLMPNRPEFMALWLGVTRIGGVVALVNTHLSGPALAYCINVVHPRPTCRASIARSTPVPATRWGTRSGAGSPSRTGRSTSTRRARPACPRPPTSTTTG